MYLYVFPVKDLLLYQMFQRTRFQPATSTCGWSVNLLNLWIVVFLIFSACRLVATNNLFNIRISVQVAQCIAEGSVPNFFGKIIFKFVWWFMDILVWFLGIFWEDYLRIILECKWKIQLLEYAIPPRPLSSPRPSQKSGPPPFLMNHCLPDNQLWHWTAFSILGMFFRGGLHLLEEKLEFMPQS